MNGVILYYSKTGFTQRYAQWLSEDTGMKALPFSEAAGLDFSSYDTVVFASWIHAGNIQKFSSFQGLNLQGKKQAVLVTGAMPGETPACAEIMERLFPKGEALRGFYMQGGLSYEKMGLMDRAMMKIFAKMVKGKEGEDSEMYRGICKSFDGTSRENLEPLKAYLRAES